MTSASRAARILKKDRLRLWFDVRPPRLVPDELTARLRCGAKCGISRGIAFGVKRRGFGHLGIACPPRAGLSVALDGVSTAIQNLTKDHI